MSASSSPSQKSRKMQKRSAASSSYSASSRSGEVPPAHSAAAESQLAVHGVILANGEGREKVSAESKQLCQDLLAAQHDVDDFPPCVGYPMEQLDKVLDRLALRNEGRVVRDLTPLLVPSPENLAFSGHREFGILAEEVVADWKLVQNMGGPTPRPDVTVGLDRGAFSAVEMKKLDNHRSWERAVFFTDAVLYPFLICEVKGSDQSINKAARQVGHAGAIAANAIWQLCRSLENASEAPREESGSRGSLNGDANGEHFASQIQPQQAVQAVEQGELPTPQHVGNQHEQAQDGIRAQAADGAADEEVDLSVDTLNGQILAFTIAHDNRTAELYGHFPVFHAGDRRPTFYRHLIELVPFLADAEPRTRKVRDFVLALYRTFAPRHLARIRAALKRMPEPEGDLFTTMQEEARAAMLMPPPSLSASQMVQQRLEAQIEALKLQQAEALKLQQAESQRQQVEFQRQLKERQEAEIRSNHQTSLLQEQLRKSAEQMEKMLAKIQQSSN